jgi:hypothetical protein
MHESMAISEDIMASKFHALVNILVKVFHSCDGVAYLNIDVALVPHGQVGVVWDDPTVVKNKA